MQYLISVVDDPDSDPVDDSVLDAEAAAIDAFNERHHAFHATRPDLLRRSGRTEGARDAYERAVELSGNAAETAFLRGRRDRLATPSAPEEPHHDRRIRPHDS